MNTPSQSTRSLPPPIVNKLESDSILIRTLRLGAFLCFAGWTWVHFYWEGPYGILLWQENTFAFASKLGIHWDEFVGTGVEDGFVQKWIARTALLFLACTILALTVRKNSWVQMGVLSGGSALLTILAYAKYVADLRRLPTFVEQGGQILMPVILVMALVIGVRHRATVATAIIAIILTFAGHGSYALGLWPTPANFNGMISVILHVEFETTTTILKLAGLLDFFVCIGILIPVLRRSCALYAAIWGFLTAIARPLAGMSWDLNYWGADQFFQEAVIRAPHFLIPLYLYFLWQRPKKVEDPQKESVSITETEHFTDATRTNPELIAKQTS